MAEMSQAPKASSQATAEMSPVYEVAFHLIPSLSEEGVASMVDKIRKSLGDAEIIAEGFPSRMILSYTIERSAQGKRERFTEAYFGWIKFAASSETIAALNEVLKMSEVLRSLVIKALREDITVMPRRAVFTSDRLEGQTLQKPTSAPEKAAEVSDEELEKSIEALTSEGV